MLFNFRQKSDLICSSPRGAKNADNQILSEAPRAVPKTQLSPCCIKHDFFQVPSEKSDHSVGSSRGVKNAASAKSELTYSRTAKI